MAAILVTGATGQLGAELVHALAPLGAVTGTDRAELDLADPAAIAATMRRVNPALIVNAGAYTSVDLAEKETTLADAVNGVAPGVLAEEARRIGALLIHYSTDYVFDGASRVPYTEDSPTGPLNVYGASKLAGEQAVAASGAIALTFRTSWVYGLRGKLLFKPSDDLDITLTARTGNSNSDGFNFVYTYLTPGAALLGAGFPGSPLFATQLLSGITVDRNNQVYSSPANAYARIKDADFSLNIDYRMGDLTFGSTTAYQHETQTNVQDLFAVNAYFFNELAGGTDLNSFPPGFNNLQTQHNDVKQVSQEFKLASSTDRDFSYLLGAFYSDSKVAETTDRGGLLGALYDVAVTPDSKTYDIFARTTWKMRPSTSLVTGLRYNYDRVGYDYIENLYTAFLPPPGDHTRFPVIVGSADYPGIPFLRVLPPFPKMTSTGSTNASVVVGDISLQQQYTIGMGVLCAMFATAGMFSTSNPGLPTVSPNSSCAATALKTRVCKCRATASVEGKLCAEAELLSVLVERP